MSKKEFLKKIKNLFEDVESIDISRNADFNGACGECTGCWGNKDYYAASQKIGNYKLVTNTCYVDPQLYYASGYEINKVNESNHTLKELFSIYESIVSEKAKTQKEYAELKNKIEKIFA